MDNTINIYNALTMKETTAVWVGEVRAHNKPQAALLLRCPIGDVKFVKHARRTAEEIISHLYITQHPVTVAGKVASVMKQMSARPVKKRSKKKAKNK